MRSIKPTFIVKETFSTNAKTNLNLERIIFNLFNFYFMSIEKLATCEIQKIALIVKDVSHC